MYKKVKPFLGNIYIGLIAMSALPILYYTKHIISTEDIPNLLFWVILIIAAEYNPVMINESGEANEITLSFAIHLTCIMLLGIEKTVWVGAMSTLLVETLLKKPWNKRVFNIGQYVTTLFISGIVFYRLKLSLPNVPLDIIKDMPALLISSTSYIFINSLFVSIIVYLTSEDSFWDILLLDLNIITGYFYSLVPISVAITFIYDPHRPYTILIMVPPLILMQQSIRRYYSLHSEARTILAALADIFDQRDKYTHDHSTRVAKYAREIAEQLNLSSNEISKIETAGLVHDIGKITIGDDIIKKESKLDEDEYIKIQKHPEIAYNLLKNLNPYKECAEYVLYHHERIDGRGYPKKMPGKLIPLGARILSVADSYDAMTSDRPYRRAMNRVQAVEELLTNKNIQFDAHVVDAFIEVLKDKYDYLEEKATCL